MQHPQLKLAGIAPHQSSLLATLRSVASPPITPIPVRIAERALRMAATTSMACRIVEVIVVVISAFAAIPH